MPASYFVLELLSQCFTLSGSTDLPFNILVRCFASQELHVAQASPNPLLAPCTCGLRNTMHAYLRATLMIFSLPGIWAALLRRTDPLPVVTPLVPHALQSPTGRFRSHSNLGMGMEVSPRQLRDLMRHRSTLRRARRHGLRKSLFGSLGAADVQARGILRLEDLSSAEYVGVLGVGTSRNCTTNGGSSELCASTPAAELRVVFDTGSADLWVASDLCTLGPCTFPSRHRFNRSSSRTFRQAARPERFETEYGSGRLAGILAADDVFVGPFRVRAQTLGLISDESGDAFVAYPIDGIVGLAFAALSTKTRPLLDHLVEENAMPKPEFAFYLHKKPSKGGAVIWGGGADRLGLHHGDMKWFPIAEERFWSLSLLGFRLGSAKEDLLHLLFPKKPQPGDGPLASAEDVPESGVLLVDTGTTFFTAPHRLFNKITEKVWPMNCDKIHTLPEFIFTAVCQQMSFASCSWHDGTLQISQIRMIVSCAKVGTNLSNRSAVHELKVPASVYMIQNAFNGDCMPGIMNMDPSPHDRPFMILGEIFLRQYFSVFQKGREPGDSWLGLAPARASEEAEQKLLLAQQMTSVSAP